MLEQDLIELQKIAATLRLSLEEVMVIHSILQANTLLTLREVLEEVEQDALDPFSRLDILKQKLNSFISKAMYDANAAVFLSNEAKEIAEDADTKADQAINASNLAISASTTATNTSLDAKDTANNALDKANIAITHSSDAITSVNAASILIDTLDTKINNVNVTATQATNKATQADIKANEAILKTLDNSNRITTLETEEHYKGLFALISDLPTIKVFDGDYADVVETNTKWVYLVDAWTDTLTPIPNTQIAASSSIPLVNSGTGDTGVSTSYARGDHVHPNDPTKATTTQLTNVESSLTANLNSKASITDLTAVESTLNSQIELINTLLTTKLDKESLGTLIDQFDLSGELKEIPAGTDINTITKTGFYIKRVTETPMGNKPFYWFSMIVLGHTGLFRGTYQIAFNRFSTGSTPDLIIKVRVQGNSKSTWSDWVQLYPIETNVSTNIETTDALNFSELVPDSSTYKFYHIPDASRVYPSPTEGDSNGGILYVAQDIHDHMVQMYIPYAGDVLYKRIYYDGTWDTYWTSIGGSTSNIAVSVPIQGTGTALGTLKIWTSTTAPSGGKWVCWGTATNNSGGTQYVTSIVSGGSSITGYQNFSGLVWRIS